MRKYLFRKVHLKVIFYVRILISALSENMTIVAEDGETGKVIGACINVEAKNEKQDQTLEESLEKYKVIF